MCVQCVNVWFLLSQSNLDDDMNPQFLYTVFDVFDSF